MASSERNALTSRTVENPTTSACNTAKKQLRIHSDALNVHCLWQGSSVLLALALLPPTSGLLAPSSWSGRAAVARFSAPPTENGLLWKATATDQKLPKIEQIKVDSQSLREPIREEFKNDEIFVSHVSESLFRVIASQPRQRQICSLT